jgi:hypothetical protein
MDSIKLEFKVTECNGWPTVNFLIDDDLYHDYHFSQEHEIVELPVDLLNGTHQLDIEIYGKRPINTQVDSNGNIVKDQIIELVNIYFNDIKLPEYYMYIGVYKFNGQEYKQALMWGCNGVWSWQFGSPILTWAMDFKLAHRAKYDVVEDEALTITYTQKKVTKTLESLDR